MRKVTVETGNTAIIFLPCHRAPPNDMTFGKRPSEGGKRTGANIWNSPAEETGQIKARHSRVDEERQHGLAPIKLIVCDKWRGLL